MADVAPCGADHSRQRCLTNVWTDRLRAAFFPKN
jgi:hypothetical protein